MQKLSQKELDEILFQHNLFLKNSSTGQKAVFKDLDLSNLNFSKKNISGIYFDNSNLNNIKFSGSKLFGAIIHSIPNSFNIKKNEFAGCYVANNFLLSKKEHLEHCEKLQDFLQLFRYKKGLMLLK